MAAWLVAAALLALPMVAHADNRQQARAHFVKGQELFSSGSYRQAISEFAAADGLAPSPVLEFNIALCHDRLGERDEAIRRYNEYLRRVPNASNKQAVEAKINRLEGEARVERAKAAEASKAEQARRAEDASKAEEARKAEAAKSADVIQDPGLGEGPAPRPVAPPAVPVNVPRPTGDPELDRVNAINIGAIRDQRRATSPPAGASEQPPPGPAANAAGANMAVNDSGKKKSKPVYKQWWFWVVVGVSAIILIDIATSGSDDDVSRALLTDPSLSYGTGGAPVLLRF